MVTVSQIRSIPSWVIASPNDISAGIVYGFVCGVVLGEDVEDLMMFDDYYIWYTFRNRTSMYYMKYDVLSEIGMSDTSESDFSLSVKDACNFLGFQQFLCPI